MAGLIDEAERRLSECRARCERLEAALVRIADNAESWHGVPGAHDCGFERALRVVGEWARDALAEETGT